MKLFDLHYHAFDLSHANIVAFLKRDDLVTTSTIQKLFKKLPWLSNILPVWLIRFFPERIANKLKILIDDYGDRVENLLGVIENAIEYHFLYTDYYLQNKKPIFKRDVGNNNFDKIVLCPLMIDFGYKNLQGDNFYNAPPKKPIVNQMVDLFNAIWNYYNFELKPHPAKYKNQRLKVDRLKSADKNKLFEIYPFLGLNTKNYTLDELETMFDKYFKGYEGDSASDRKQKLKDKMGTVRLKLEDINNSDIDFSYFFAGIKLYPPLGFDPWPEDTEELEKVKFLYKTCIQKNIPITVHCSDGGFVVDKNSKLYTDPRTQWSKVLKQDAYCNLKINFAHMGKQKSGNKEWENHIFHLMDTNPNVYSDISCCAFNRNYYKSLKERMNDERFQRTLFGSDFLINLLFTRSYNDYLDYFLSTENLEKDEKVLIGNINGERFLFG